MNRLKPVVSLGRIPWKLNSRSDHPEADVAPTLVTLMYAQDSYVRSSQAGICRTPTKRRGNADRPPLTDVLMQEFSLASDPGMNC